MIRKEEALNYHSRGRKGKIEVCATKPCTTQRDLSLAYTPGVAEPCREITKEPNQVFNYTAKGNLVAVISNGTAVLGLGDIGPEAGKPVMEGKGVLFKRFADIDVFDIELNTKDSDEFIKAVQLMEPTFGGINLEDIKAPECFYIEEQLKEMLDIPVFHDDQHGTAIISGAALLNALELQGKNIEDVKVVFSGAGAAGIACADLYISLGVKHENLYLVDSKGLVYNGRTKGMNPYKERYANGDKEASLEEVMVGADVFAGVSIGGLVTKEMVKSMNDNPIIFAMANPDPEITYDDALDARKDIVMATGRSDFPNQVNNVLGFPFIFRGALDVRARAINEEMKIAAVKSLADLAKEDVPDSVIKAYGGEALRFGKEYIIPKPFDPRVLIWEAMAVAKAAVSTGVARQPIQDWDAYQKNLESHLGRSYEVMRFVIDKAKQKKKRLVFPEGEELQILRAIQQILEENIAEPMLIGNPEKINKIAADNNIEIKGATLVDPHKFRKHDKYAATLHELRQRKGLTMNACKRLLLNEPNVLGVMMVREGDADAMLSGVNHYYPEVIRPALQILETGKDKKIVAGLYAMVMKDETLFFADTTVNTNPSAETLAEVAILTADEVRHTFDIEPRIAMLSYSNFGSVRNAETIRVATATQLVKERRPDLEIDGEMQVDPALDFDLLNDQYAFSTLKQRANVLIFPSLEAGNIAYKLMSRVGGGEAIGPILVGLEKSVHVLQRHSDVDTIVRMSAIASIDAE
ncbi:MAG: NADP-dependent malic enzyme [Caldithrix sp.]|nr:NADP-dependent malic enzyme [Caldithrix sp.]